MFRRLIYAKHFLSWKISREKANGEVADGRRLPYLAGAAVALSYRLLLVGSLHLSRP